MLTDIDNLTDGIDESIEPAFRLGEWSTQAELTWRHQGRGTRRVVTYAVVHVPANAVAERFLSRTEARQLVRWLARDVPHLDPDGQGPLDALRRLSVIRAAIRYVRRSRESVATLARSDWMARAREMFPEWDVMTSMDDNAACAAEGATT